MYIPLFNKSNYSLLSSLLKIDDIVSYAKESNISEIAIADTNMYGTMEFINKCKKEDIKPIIGLHILLEEFSIVLYAKDYDGYKSLIKLSSIQNERKVSKEELSKDYLRKKLGFKDNSRLNSFGNDLINSIIWSINRNQSYYDNNISYKEIETLFGQAVAQKSEELRKKGYHVYYLSLSR